jgi:hypothetical protein
MFRATRAKDVNRGFWHRLNPYSSARQAALGGRPAALRGVSVIFKLSICVKSATEVNVLGYRQQSR